MSLLRHKLFLAVSLAHFIIDVFSNMGSVLVTYLSIPMALSDSQVGRAIGTYQLIAATTQPFFGWLSDKMGSRWLGSLSVPWTVTFLALAVLVGQTTNNFYLFMILFSLGAVGSGAFHPQGAMHAATSFTRRAATATAIFFLFGQAGLAGGPLIAGLILDHVGPAGVYVLACLSIPLLLYIGYAMRGATDHRPAATASRPDQQPVIAATRVRWGAIGLLALLIGLRSWAFLGTVSFLPRMFQTMGWTPTSYGAITSIFWLASAVTGVLAGNLADRWGRRQVVFITLLVGSVPLYFMPLTDSWLAFLLAIVGGGLLGASHSIVIVIAQTVLPGGKAFASGVTMGYMFGIGAVAVWGIGALADTWSLTLVIQIGAGIGMLAALTALFLPATRETPQPQPERVPA